MTVKLVRDALGSDVPQTVDGNGNITVRATGDTTGVDFGKTKLLRDALGSPLPNQIYDVDAKKWVIDESGGSGGGGTGPQGPRGYSAYQVAVMNGFVGTEEQWLESLKGKDGPPGTTDYTQLTNKPFIPTTTNQLINDSGFITQVILNALKNVADGIAGLDANGLISLAQLPPSTKELRVVADLAARDALDTFEGLGCYVKDAVPEVSSGGAFYMHDGATWFKTATDSDFTAVLDWSNITNKPTEFYTLPKASVNTLGGVKVDGTTIVTDENGVLRVIGGGAAPELTKEAITNALTYTPANDEDLTELERKFNEHSAQIEALGERVEVLEKKPRQATLHCVVSEITPNSKSGNAKVPYNATISSIDASVDAASGLQLNYIIEKLSGNAWSQIGSSSILVGQNSRTTSLNVNVNENDWIRVVAQSENEDVQLLTVSLSITERGV